MIVCGSYGHGAYVSVLCYSCSARANVGENSSDSSSPERSEDEAEPEPSTQNGKKRRGKGPVAELGERQKRNRVNEAYVVLLW